MLFFPIIVQPTSFQKRGRGLRRIRFVSKPVIGMRVVKRFLDIRLNMNLDISLLCLLAILEEWVKKMPQDFEAHFHRKFEKREDTSPV